MIMFFSLLLWNLLNLVWVLFFLLLRVQVNILIIVWYPFSSKVDGRFIDTTDIIGNDDKDNSDKDDNDNGNDNTTSISFFFQYLVSQSNSTLLASGNLNRL